MDGDSSCIEGITFVYGVWNWPPNEGMTRYWSVALLKMTFNLPMP